MIFRRIRRFLTGNTLENPDLCRAQIKGSSLQIPMMYGVVAISTISLAYTHQSIAPAFLTIYIPAALVVLAVLRSLIFIRARKVEMTDQQVIKRVKSVPIVAVLAGSAFVGWAISLYGYGDITSKGHVAFYSSISMLGAAVCLMHFRNAVIGLILIVSVPMTLLLVLEGDMVLNSLAVNLGLTSTVILLVLLRYYRGFAIR